MKSNSIIGKILYDKGLEIKRTLPRPMIRFIKKNLPGNLVGVEIGCFRGLNSQSILQMLPIKKLYLIDPYIGYDDGGLNPHKSLENAKEEFIERVSKFNSSNWIFLCKTSDEAFKSVPDKLDFVYIDGNHSYEYVKRDLNNYFEKLKHGGIIGGHDFYNGLCPEHDGVVKAVMEFVQENGLKLYAQYPDWWVIKK